MFFDGSSILSALSAEDINALEIPSGSPNQPPVAAGDAYATNEDIALNVAAPGVLGNDSDSDGDSLTAAIVGGASHGSVSLNANGSFSYTPNLDYSGPDSFTYRANDGVSDSNIVTVDITVNSINDAPVADSQGVAAKEDTPKAITLTSSDVDSPTLTYTVVSGPDHGVLSGSAPNLSYTPDTAYIGPDSFTFKANDGTDDSNVATVSINVAANNPPVATAQAVSVAEDDSVPILLMGSDPDGDPITYSLDSYPAHGSLTGTLPNLSYRPDANYEGPDSFGFKVNDGTDDGLVAVVSIDVTAVNDVPVAYAQSVSTAEDTATPVTLTGNDIDGDLLNFVIVDPPSSGILGGSGANRTYTPGANFNGSDSFTFKVNDGTVESSVVTVAITVTPVNDAPTAVGDSDVTTEDAAVNIAVLANDSDVDGNTLTVDSVTQGTLGSVVIEADQTLTYTPNPGVTGSDSFTYTVADGNGGFDTATVNVTINPSGPPPLDDTVLVAHWTFDGVTTDSAPTEPMMTMARWWLTRRSQTMPRVDRC